MPTFINYLIACKAVDEKNATADQRAVKKMYKTILPAMKENPTSVMSRLFDGAMPTMRWMR